jgi:hypothetical protein
MHPQSRRGPRLRVQFPQRPPLHRHRKSPNPSALSAFVCSQRCARQRVYDVHCCSIPASVLYKVFLSLGGSDLEWTQIYRQEHDEVAAFVRDRSTLLQQ